MKHWQQVWRLLLLMVLMLTLAGCGKPYLSALDPKGPVAAEQLDLILLSSYIMIGVFVVVAIIYTYVLVRFRKKQGQDEIPEQVEGNHKLEIIWTVVPIILLVFLAIPTVISTFDLAEEYPAGEAVQIRVTSHQFWWEFEYTEHGFKTAQEFYVPVGKKVQFVTTSADVIHSFWVPALGGKIDTNPGQETTIWLQADEAGRYEGRCAELCGSAHALMNFQVVAVEQAEFDNWVAQMQGYAPEPETDLATQGSLVFQQNCITCHAIGAEGGQSAPNLAGFANRALVAGIMANTPENVAEWIKAPQVYKPGNSMPGFAQLADEEIAALVEYLGSLDLND